MSLKIGKMGTYTFPMELKFLWEMREVVKKLPQKFEPDWERLEVDLSWFAEILGQKSAILAVFKDFFSKYGQNRVLIPP